MNRPTYFEILAADPEKLAEFYAQVFGWDVQSGAAGQAYWPVRTGPPTDTGINGGFMGEHFGQPVINTIEVESSDEVLAAIVSHGGEVVHGPNEIPGVGTHAYCRDPQGVMFGILQPGSAA
jgi:predicted enzyme related to lactoylglutathione lyase